MEGSDSIPNALQMHWADFDNMSGLFALQDTVTTSSCHAGNVQKLCTVDHVII